ncbi:unnamed protein product, partial [Rotaria sp. Silwood2]
MEGTRSNKSETFSGSSKIVTPVSINIRDINFDKFELMIKNLFNQLQILHLTTNYDGTYFDANRWEQYFQHINPIENNTDNYQLIYESVV